MTEGATTSLLEELYLREDFTTELFREIELYLLKDADRRGELRDLLRRWDQFSGNYPNRTHANVLEGFSCLVLGDLARAEEVLRNARRSEWGYYFLIQVLVSLGRQEEAVQVAEEAFERFADSMPVAFTLVDVWLQTGWEEEAEKLLKKAKRRAEETAQFQMLTGYLAERMGEYEEACEKYKKAAEIDPECSRAFFRLGYLNGLHGNEDRALEAYEKCLRISPVHVNALMNLGVMYEDRERYHDAIRCFQTVLRYYPTHERAKLYLGDARASTVMFYDRDEEKKADRQSQILRIPVSDFELSVRSRNCLSKMNIQTLGDLIMKTEEELLAYKNFGETSLKEIKDMLAQKGLRLGQGLEEGKARAENLLREIETPENKETLDQPIEALSLSVRSQRCMERLGVKTIRDLCLRTEMELMSAKNFGMTSLNEIKRRLSELGLRLRG